MPAAPLPYEAKNKPVELYEDYNGAHFKIVRWMPDLLVPYLGKVFYVHGFAEDLIVYTRFFDNLALKGVEVFFFGQRGALETSPNAIGKTDEFHVFDDVDHFLKGELDRRTDTNEKFVMMGHSMGGGIVLNYGIRGKYRDQLRGIVACGPLVELHPKTQVNIVVRKLQPLINKIAPWLTIDSGLNFDHITLDDKWRKWLKDSEPVLVGTIRQYNDMFVRGLALLDAAYVAKWDKNIAVLIVHGTDDYINDIEASKKFDALLPGLIKHEHYPAVKGRHSLFIEKQEIYDEVFDKVIKFIENTKGN